MNSILKNGNYGIPEIDSESSDDDDEVVINKPKISINMDLKVLKKPAEPEQPQVDSNFLHPFLKTANIEEPYENMKEDTVVIKPLTDVKSTVRYRKSHLCFIGKFQHFAKKFDKVKRGATKIP